MRKRRPLQLELPLRHRTREPVTHAHIVLSGRIVEYRIRRSRRRRSITLTIDEQGLRIGAPWQAGELAIKRQLDRHADWVLKKLDEWSQRRPPPRAWQDGETVMLLGEPLRLTLHDEPQAPVLRAGCLMVGAPVPRRAAEVEVGVTRWLRECALVCFEERIAHYAPLLSVRAPLLRLSDARTRWGSCHPTGYILLNWRLIHFPLPLLDYVVVHELAHLRELNHSTRFWRLVATVIPDHAQRRAQLRTCSHQYIAA